LIGAYYEQLKPDQDLYAGLGAAISVQVTMFFIFLHKYWEDFSLVLQGKGGEPYKDEAGNVIDASTPDGRPLVGPTHLERLEEPKVKSLQAAYEENEADE
jgi:hypothetical protein